MVGPERICPPNQVTLYPEILLLEDFGEALAALSDPLHPDLVSGFRKLPWRNTGRTVGLVGLS